MKVFDKTVITIISLLFSNMFLITGEISLKITKRYLNFLVSHSQLRVCLN